MGRPNRETKTGPVGTFDPALFRKAIQALGLTFHWSRALECPCRLDNSDQFSPTCDRCGGDGWWYVNPDARTDRHHDRDYLPVQAAFSMARMNPSMYESFGGFDFGEAQMTVQPECRVGYRDRFIGVEMEMAHTELLKRAAGDVVSVGKTGRTTTEQQTSMRYEPVRINYVADNAGNKYWKDSHWRLREATATEPTRLVWLDGPPTGTLYTVHYACRPVWIVDDAVYGVQGLLSPDATLKGIREPQVLPMTFKVKLDFLTMARGT